MLKCGPFLCSATGIGMAERTSIHCGHHRHHYNDLEVLNFCKVFLFLSFNLISFEFDNFSKSFFIICQTLLTFFRVTTRVKIEQQNKEIIIFGRKNAKLREAVYPQSSLGGWPSLLENYSKISS